MSSVIRRKSTENHNAAAYIRVSTDEQTEYSPDSQLKIILDYASSHRMTVSPEHIYSDEGISGRSAAKRPAFMKMIADAKSGSAFSHILVWKYSRFARSREDSIIYKSMLKKQYGIDVISVSESLGGDKTDILIEAMLEAMDEYYSLNLAEEVKRGMAEKFSRGGIITNAPIGYAVTDGRLTVDEVGAAAVRTAFALYIGGYSLSDTARAMNKCGMRTANGHEFDCRAVKYILTNPVYIGRLRMKTDADGDYYGRSSKTVKGTHEPIIDEESFIKASEMLSSSVRRS